MSDDLKTLAAWSKELGLSEKKLKDAVKAAGLQPDAKKGVCGYWAKATVEGALKG